MMGWLLAAALVCLLAGWWLLRRGRLSRQKTGVPAGRLVYADTYPTDWHPPPRPLFSAAHNLVGRPDYLVRTPRGMVPVEVKSGETPDAPYWGHVLQLAAYCLLVEAATGQTPRYGLLKYSTALYEIEFSSELRQELLDTLAQIRRDRMSPQVHRDHNRPGKCAACGFRPVCGESLV